jgi:hypothetical protein
MTALELDVTFCVRPEKVALVFPAWMLTLAGTVATAVLLLESVTTAPPAGAAVLRVTVPSTLLPALTLAGFKDTDETNTVGAGVIVTAACIVLSPRLAVIVTGVLLNTPGLAVNVKVPVEAPAGTVIVAGTSPKALSVLSPTMAPPAGAAPVRVTVPSDHIARRFCQH